MNGGSARDDDAELPAGVDSELDSVLRRADRVGDQVLGPPLPQPGRVVGDKYRIEECLGRGGMGAVFRATHLVSEKAVALKWMLRSTSDDHARRRFLREARMAARIDHPNVVDVYDVGEDGDCGYLVMELLHGEPLRARFARGSLEVSELVDLLLPAMRGVAAVHRAGVNHRDLKPDNIFLCKGPDGTPREAKVLDFGISALTSCDPNDPTLTKDGAVLGTPAYMSPEQVQSARDIDARSDVYSFGVILYEGLTGKLPFEGLSYNGLILAIVHAEPKAPAELRPQLPRELSAIVSRALAKQREDRYANVESLIAALLPYASIRGTDSGANAATSALRPQRARWFAWALAGCVVATILVAAWLRSAKHELERPPPTMSSAVTVPKDQAGVAPTPVQPSTPLAMPAVQAPSSGGVPASNAHGSNPPPQKTKSKGKAPEARAVEPSQAPAQKQRSGSISVDQL
jgi:serine/threonine protein kinase